MSWAKVLQFALKNWREILVIFSLSLVSLKMRMDYNALNKAYEISKQETEERIEALQYIHSEELARREQAIDTYKEAMKELRDEYNKSQEDLEKTISISMRNTSGRSVLQKGEIANIGWSSESLVLLE